MQGFPKSHFAGHAFHAWGEAFGGGCLGLLVLFRIGTSGKILPVIVQSPGRREVVAWRSSLSLETQQGESISALQLKLGCCICIHLGVLSIKALITIEPQKAMKKILAGSLRCAMVPWSCWGEDHKTLGQGTAGKWGALLHWAVCARGAARQDRYPQQVVLEKKESDFLCGTTC